MPQRYAHATRAIDLDSIPSHAEWVFVGARLIYGNCQICDKFGMLNPGAIGAQQLSELFMRFCSFSESGGLRVAKLCGAA